MIRKRGATGAPDAARKVAARTAGAAPARDAEVPAGPAESSEPAAQPGPAAQGDTATIDTASINTALIDETPIDDRTLLARHVAGDPEAFSVLFSRHRDRLWAVALRTAGDPEDAADALQEAAISAFRAADRFRGDSAVGTWLYRIVVNACVDRLRSKAARPTVRYPDEQSAGWTKATRDPSDMADIRDLRIVLEQALAKLPVEQRAAVVAVDVEGLSVDDASSVLGVPVGTVKSRCFRGRAKLAELLADLRGGSRGSASKGEESVSGRNRAAPGAVQGPDGRDPGGVDRGPEGAGPAQPPGHALDRGTGSEPRNRGGQ
jgi:RNA polymerase sigma-70 factor, ECF subfamily